jgi:hypothetical protein
MIWHILKPLLIFPKGLLGGIIAATLMWAVLIFYYNQRWAENVRRLGYEGPTATAGGWEYIVQVPWVVVLLSVAFGVGFYLVVSWVARHP